MDGFWPQPGSPLAQWHPFSASPFSLSWAVSHADASCEFWVGHHLFKAQNEMDRLVIMKQETSVTPMDPVNVKKAN